MFSDGILGKASREMVVNQVASFVPLQENAAERTLLDFLPDCLEWLEQIGRADRDDIRAVLEKITHGQMLDLHRFGDPAQVRALETAADLDEYTYLVAGCVGEFWTRLCFRHLRDFASLTQDEMLALGRRYGMGLQLINVLRDAGTDLRAGRCYFPHDELRAIGLSAAQILSRVGSFPTDLSKMDGKSAGWVGVRDAVFARDPEPASACSHGLAGVDRGAHPCASP